MVCTCQFKSFENAAGEGEIACYKQLLLSPQCFLLVWRAFSHFYQFMKLLPARSSSLEESEIYCWERHKFSCIRLAVLVTFNPFPNKPWFLSVCSISLLKILWEKEKLLVMSNFSFSRSVFYPFGELSAIFIKFEFVVCKLFQFGRV